MASTDGHTDDADGRPHGVDESSPARTPSSQREVEWKLVSTEQVGIEAIRSLLPTVTVGPGSAFTLTATYYDTHDLRLARRGITLRRRTGGSDDGWHLKLPHHGDSDSVLDRDEIALPLDHRSEPPAELRSLVAAYARHEPVRSIGVLRTHRTVHPLIAPGGAVIGELSRDEVRADISLNSPGGAPTVVFHEWELEARVGAIDEAAKVVDTLLAGGFAVSTSGSKLRQALGAQALVPDDLAHDEKPSRRRSARDDITYYLKEQVEALLAQDHRVRMGLPDAVHKSRVAARRIRSALRTFAPLLHSEALAELRADVVWAAEILGRQRDLEIVEERLTAILEQMSGETHEGAARTAAQPGIEEARKLVVADLTERERLAHRDVMQAIDSPRWITMLDSLVAVAHDPPTTTRAEKSASRVLPPLAAKQWKSLADRAKHLDGSQPPESWHHARISAKRARYAAEACAPAMGREPERFARALADVTELLGDLHDTDVSRAYLTELVHSGVEDADALFVLGQVFAAEDRAAERMRSEFPHVWDKTSRPRLRRWLRS